MAYIPLSIIVLEFFFTVILVNCLREIVGQDSDLFEYEDLDTETVQPPADDSDIIVGRDMGQGLEGEKKPFYCLGQGRFMLFFVPGVKHCSVLSYQILDTASMGWKELGCSEAPVMGWMWAFEVVPGFLNRYRVFGKLNLRPVLIGEATVLSDRPPPIKSHLLSFGPGWVSLWVKLPEESQPNLLGIRVRFVDAEWAKDGDLQSAEIWNKSILTNNRFFENVKYAGSKAMAWPVHRCPHWPLSKMYCMLFTDKFSYTSDWKKKQQFSEKIQGWGKTKSPKDTKALGNSTTTFMMETYRIPYYYPMSIYGDKYNIVVPHLDCNPYTECPELAGRLPSLGDYEELNAIIMPPMFDGSEPRKKPQPRYWPRENQLWVIFIVLTLFVLAVILPIIFYIATRAGYRAADALWSSWAEAPGNIIVGLGYTTVAWQGQQPAWKYEPRGG